MKYTLAIIAVMVSNVFATIVNAQSDGVSWLFAQTSSVFKADGSSLRLPIEREIFAFSDRPNRVSRYLNAQEFVFLWGPGDGSFSEDPPNAVITWLEEGEAKEAEILLKFASVSEMGRSIEYNFSWLNGDVLPSRGEGVSLFIDDAVDTVMINLLTVGICNFSDMGCK
ncbi:hypothetical protein MWN63_15310 [Paradonghicola geojensis]|nr:hypothetical protein [Marivivens geojensis]